MNDWQEAAALIKDLDAQVPTLDTGICRHCGKKIVFKPYYLDGKQPSPPIWFHPPGSETCSTNPDKGKPWPRAEPLQ